MINKSYYIYILSSSKRGTLYIGVTNNLIRRITEHKKEINNGFTSKYHIKDLVYFEQTDNIESALQREKRIKKWNRQWKIELIEANNPKWNDLFSDL